MQKLIRLQKHNVKKSNTQTTSSLMQPFNPGFNNVFQQPSAVQPATPDQAKTPHNPSHVQQQGSSLDGSFAQLSLQQNYPTQVPPSTYPPMFKPLNYVAPPPTSFGMQQQPFSTMGSYPTNLPPPTMPPSTMASFQQMPPTTAPPTNLPPMFGSQQQQAPASPQQQVNYFGTPMIAPPPTNVPAANLYDISTVASPVQGYQTPQVQRM